VSRYAGRWDLIAGESDNIDRAIEGTIASMSFITRPIARVKLKRRNVAFPSFQLDVSDHEIHVKHEQGLDVAYPASGVAVKTRAPDGTDVVAVIQIDPTLMQSYVADNAVREDRYLLSDDGSRLTIAVRITSVHLPKPLVYKLVYQRSIR